MPKLPRRNQESDVTRMMRMRCLALAGILLCCVISKGRADGINDLLIRPAQLHSRLQDDRALVLRMPRTDGRAWRPLIATAATENNLPVEFLERILRRESGYFPFAVSRAGAQGIAQFMPETARQRALLDPFDPHEAIKAAAAYLRDLRSQFGSLSLAAAAYNAGPARVRKFLAGQGGLPRETTAYVRAITNVTLAPRSNRPEQTASSLMTASRKLTTQRTVPLSEALLCQNLNSPERPCKLQSVY